MDRCAAFERIESVIHSDVNCCVSLSIKQTKWTVKFIRFFVPYVRAGPSRGWARRGKLRNLTWRF